MKSLMFSAFFLISTSVSAAYLVSVYKQDQQAIYVNASNLDECQRGMKGIAEKLEKTTKLSLITRCEKGYTSSSYTGTIVYLQ